MILSECFDAIKASNQAIKDTNVKLDFYTSTFIQNKNDCGTLVRYCQTEDEFLKYVREIAEDVKDDDPEFYINVLTKDCDFPFDDGKATIHYADPTIGKMITVRLMLHLAMQYNMEGLRI